MSEIGMSNPERTETDYLPYELTAELDARDHMQRLRDKYGDNPHVLMTYLEAEIKDIVHEGIKYGLWVGKHLGDVGPVDVLQAFSDGTYYSHVKESDDGDSN